MPSLPDPGGRFPVGATTFVRPIRPALAIGKSQVNKPTSSAKHSHLHNTTHSAKDNLEPTLVLEEVAFTVYYPADLRHGGGWLGGKVAKHSIGLDWVPKPAEETVRGYEHFGGQSYPGWIGSILRPIISLLGSRIKIPAYDNAPLHAPEESTPWPFVIFSHGLGGARTTYSNLCTRLAAEGRVVIALEHRDGTGPAVFPRGADDTRKSLYYVNPSNVIWPDDDPNAPPESGQNKYSSDRALRLRTDQLEFRRQEVFAAIAAFRGMVEGASDRGGLEVMDGKDIDWASWKNKIDFHTVDIVGHSFGGATLFSLLSSPPSTIPNTQQTYSPLPIRRALALDPWMEPLSSPGPQPKAPNDLAPELLVINSEAFTIWESHFASLQSAVRAFAPARLLTLARAQHIAFSDFPLVIPTRFQSVDAARMLRLVDSLSQSFLNGQLRLDSPELPLEGVPTRKMEITTDEKGKRRLVAEEGDVIVH